MRREENEVLARARRIESRLVNLSDYIGCSLGPRHKRAAMERVHVRGNTLIVTTPAATLGDMTLAIHESGEEGEFEVIMAGRIWGHVRYVRNEENEA